MPDLLQRRRERPGKLLGSCSQGVVKNAGSSANTLRPWAPLPPKFGAGMWGKLRRSFSVRSEASGARASARSFCDRVSVTTAPVTQAEWMNSPPEHRRAVRSGTDGFRASSGAGTWPSQAGEARAPLHLLCTQALQSFLEALQRRLPPISESGTVVYFAIRPMALYRDTATGYHLLEHEAQHWIAFNGWPCERPAAWSPHIYLIPEAGGRHWKVRLLSMTFHRYDANKQDYEPLDDLDARTITFGGDGLIVHLDCGTSVTFVPPSLVRHIRTKLWPTPENKKIDAKYRDTPCNLGDMPMAVPFYVPGDSDPMSVVDTFADGRGNEVQAVGPITHFFNEPNPHDHSHSKAKEGLIFVGPPDVIGGEAIFGLNFFQSMFVALYNPGDGAAYVKLAPQWDSQRVQFSPRPEADGHL